MSAEERLRREIRFVLKATGTSQAHVARQLGITTKHLCQMLTGRATLTLEWADKILDVCGYVVSAHAVPRMPMKQPGVPWAA